MAKNKYAFEPEICDGCGQSKTYLLPIDWGTAVIVKAVAARIRAKQINIVHPTKEMEVPGDEWSYDRAVTEGVLTSTQIGNFTRARVHGLIARHQTETGNWLLTKKGAQFLRGDRIPNLAVIKKCRKVADEDAREASHKVDYFMPETYSCTIHEIMRPGSKTPVWEGIDFDIVEGRIVLDLPAKKTAPSLF
jgi:hypothetical protein